MMNLGKKLLICHRIYQLEKKMMNLQSLFGSCVENKTRLEKESIQCNIGSENQLTSSVSLRNERRSEVIATIKIIYKAIIFFQNDVIFVYKVMYHFYMFFQNDVIFLYKLMYHFYMFSVST